MDPIKKWKVKSGEVVRVAGTLYKGGDTFSAYHHEVANQTNKLELMAIGRMMTSFSRRTQ